jgi:Kazal-type serine protease inhibitor domain
VQVRAVRFGFLLLPLILGCSEPGTAQEPPQPKLTVPNAKFCAGPRPEMCMEIYQPVCGFTQEGKSHTYSNSCHACAKAEVVRYEPGECREDTERKSGAPH